MTQTSSFISTRLKLDHVRRQDRFMLLQRDVASLKRKYIDLQEEEQVLQKEVDEYEALRNENRLLTQTVIRNRKLRKYIFSLVEAGNHIERNLSFNSPLLKNSHFIHGLGARVLLETAHRSCMDLPDLCSPSGLERSLMLENFIRSQETLSFDERQALYHKSHEPKMIVRRGTDTNGDFNESWLRIEINEFPVSLKRCSEFSEWCVSSRTYLDIFRHYLLNKHGQCDLNIEGINSILQSVEINTANGQEKLFSYVQDYRTDTSFTSIRAYLPTIDFDFHTAHMSASSYVEVIEFSQGQTDDTTNFVLVRRFKTPKKAPEKLCDVEYLPSYESIGLKDYLNDFGLNAVQVAASLKVFFALVPFIQVKSC